MSIFNILSKYIWIIVEIFLQSIPMILSFIVGIIGGAIAFKFDINKFIEQRRKSKIAKLKAQLKRSCPHFKIILTEKDQIVIYPLFITQPGTLFFQCSNCGALMPIDLREVYIRQLQSQINSLQKMQYYMKQLDKSFKLKRELDRLIIDE